VFTHDHLASKVDTLFQKFEKLNVSVIPPPSIPSIPPCEIYGIVGHTDIECQLGVSAESFVYNDHELVDFYSLGFVEII